MALKKEDHISIKVYEDFMKGEKPFPEAEFTLRSDIWELHYRETQAVTASQSRIMFHYYSDWIKPIFQDFIAYCLFYEGLSNGTLKNTVLSIKFFYSYLRDYHSKINDIKDLDETIARKYASFLLNSTDITSIRKYRHFNTIKKFSKWLKGRKLGDSSFRFGNNPFSNPTQKKGTIAESQSKAIPVEITEQIMKGIKNEELEQEEILKSDNSKKNEKDFARTKLIYCQILKILIASGRRISHVIQIERNPLVEPREGDSEGVWLEWNETKTNQGLQPVFIPAPLDGLVKEAVEITQNLTKPILNDVTAKERKKLFLKSDHRGPGCITATNFRTWLNGDKKVTGFNVRHNIQFDGKIYHIKPHGFRHARATEMYLGGAGHGTVQNDLAHVSGSMTDRYIHIYGENHAVSEMHELMSKGELMGKLSSYVTGENEIEEEKELTLDDAKKQLVDLGRKVEENMIPNEQFEFWEKNGMAAQYTRYGYCVYPLEKGTCPVGDPCWIGKDGHGCEYHLYGPEIKEQVEKDLQRVEERLNRMLEKSPNSPLVGHYKTILSRGNNIINGCNKGCGGCQSK